MSGLAWTLTALGVLIIATRGPLIFAPDATLAFYRRLFGSAVALRGIGVALTGMGMALVATSDGAEHAEGFVAALGWFIACFAILFLVILPSVFQSIGEFFLDLIRDVARPIGAIAVAAGAALIYFAVAVL